MLRKHFFLLAIVLIVGVIVFAPSLKFALFGDDWLVLYIFKNQVLRGDIGFSPWNPRSYLSPYGVTYLLMGVLDKFFGLNPFPYFVTSLVCRSLATIAVYTFVYFLTKKKLSAFAASIFWAVSEIGIESTNWVFNMNSYIGLALFLVTLVFYLKYHESRNKIDLLVSVILLSLASIAVPVRMHGAFVVLIGMEIFFFKSLKKFILLNLVWIITFVTLSSWKVFGSGNFDIYVGKGLRENLAAIQIGKYNHLLTPLTTIGNFLFVDHYMSQTQIPRIIYKSYGITWLKSFLLPLAVITSVILAIVGFLVITPSKRKLFALIISIFMCGLAFLINMITIRGNIEHLPPNMVFLTMAGGTLLGFITLLIFFTKPGSSKTGLFIGLIWLIGFGAVPLLFSPLSYIVSSMRYMIMPGVAIALMMGLLFSLTNGRLQSLFLLVLVSPLYFIQYFSTQAYFKNLLISREQSISKTIWEKILSTIPPMDISQDYMFYFEPSLGKDAIVRDVITFGFIPRMIVYGKTPDRPGGIYVVERPSEFISAITDGEELKRFNWGKSKKINVTNTFAFRVEQDNSLTNIKSEILYGPR